MTQPTGPSDGRHDDPTQRIPDGPWQDWPAGPQGAHPGQQPPGQQPPGQQPPGQQPPGGQPLGTRYRLFDVIGRGAMGEVRVGVTSDGEEVAVKVLRPELAEDPAMVGRFLQERGILTSLRHPNIVGVRDLVAEGSTLAIVMDLVRGPDLRTELVRRGTLAPAEATAVVIGVLRGLAAVHAAGVVHRDIKPENVLLEPVATGGYVARLSDFGISKLVSGNVTSRRTSVIGTPDYMAPELIDDAPPTVASDLYSVGILLYELVCGVPPFTGGSPLAVLRRHAEQAPGRPPGMPDPLWWIIGELLAKDPAARPANAPIVAASLESVLAPLAPLAALPPLTAPPPPDPDGLTVLNPLTARTTSEQPGSRRSRVALVAVAVAALVVLGAGGATAFALMNRGGAAAGGSSSSSTGSPAASSSSSSSSSSTESSSSSDAPSPADSSPSPTGVPTVSTAGPGNPGAVLPRLVGKQLADAVGSLSALGVHYQVVEDLNPKATDNVVVDQAPKAGQPAGDLVTLTVSRVAVVTNLADIAAVSQDPSKDPVDIDGQTYVHPISWGQYCSSSDPVVYEYDLGKDYRRLQGVLGVSDQSASGSQFTIDVYADDRKISSKRVSLGKPVRLDLDVTGTLRLKIVSTAVCSVDGTNVVAIGDAQLLALPSALPSPSSS